ALSMGAVDVVAKPSRGLESGLAGFSRDLLGRLRAVAGRRLRHAVPAPPRARLAKTPTRLPARLVVALAASTAGPAALAELLPRLPADLPAAVVIVQHMPPGFTEMLAARLDQSCPLVVEEARDGDVLRDGRVLIAPGGRHLRVRLTGAGPVTLLSGGPAVAGHRPSADVLFRSVAEHFAPHSVGVVLTGVGEDGAAGLGAIRRGLGAAIAPDAEASRV